MTARAVLDRSMTEDQLLTAVTDALTLYHWKWVHFRRSDKAQMMGSAGFPDICAARKGRILFLELKSDRGKLSDAQWQWADALVPYWYVIQPADLDKLLGRLA